MANIKKYPFDVMAVGDEVIINDTTPNAVRASVFQFCKANKGYKFSVRKCHMGSVLKRVPCDVVDEEKYATYVLSLDRSVSYFGPSDYQTANQALQILRDRGVDMADPVVAQCEVSKTPAGYLNEWVGL